TRDIKLVVHLGVRKGVQGEAAIAAQVMDLRRVVADEDIQTTMGNDRADWMDARSPVLADRSQIAEPDADLIDESPSCLGHVGLLGCKLTPTLHSLLSVSYERRATRYAVLRSSAAQRCASAAAGSGSAADAGDSQLHARHWARALAETWRFPGLLRHRGLLLPH